MKNKKVEERKPVDAAKHAEQLVIIDEETLIPDEMWVEVERLMRSNKYKIVVKGG